MTETTSSPKDQHSKPTKAYSCVRCFERKVKCDKDHPCASCVRSNVDCIFRVPAPPKRKKKRTQEDILTERLNQYEQLLQQKGIDVNNVTTQKESPKVETSSERNVARSETLSAARTASTPSDLDPRSFVAPKLIWEEGRSRFTENNLWTRVTEEFATSQDVIHESSSDDEEGDHESHEMDDNIDFTLGLTPGSSATRSLHPQPDHIMMLWQIFLENVNPFSMLVHRPTMHATIQKAMVNVDHLPRGLEAVLFSIYAAAVMSMQDRDVDETFGESRATLLSRYRTATKSALARAKFMGSSDILVLTALVLHLLAMRDVYDGRTLWTLTGVALRMAEGMGLHRDGETLGLPPFRTELRRRIFHQINVIDYRSAELSGSGKYGASMLNIQVFTKMPSNINDEDMWPSMTEPPKPRQKITDMILCCLRYEFSNFWREKLSQRPELLKETFFSNYRSPKMMEEHDAAINELEQRIEEKYIRFCDPSIPVQLMASLVARSATNSMRFMAHHPRRWASDNEIPEPERALIWSLCIRILEGYIMCITAKSLQRFAWHTSFYFQWQALIYLLDCVRADPLMPEADDAWKHVGEVFECHPNFITNTKKAIHVAVGSLCLKAYSAKEQAFRREGRFLPARPPEYIQILRKQRELMAAKQAERRTKVEAQQKSQSDPSSSISNDLVNMMGFETTPQFSALQIQQPLPEFQAPKSQQQQSPQQQQQQQQNQQHVASWFDNYSSLNSQMMGSNMDWMLIQDPAVDQNHQMDWSQWDYILNDSTGMMPFTDIRSLQ